MKDGGHIWVDCGTRCECCECSREDFYDGLRPACNPVYNAVVLFRMAAVRYWNRAVRRAAHTLLIGGPRL